MSQFLYSKSATFTGRNAKSKAAKFILQAQEEAITFANGKAKVRLVTGWDAETVATITKKGGVWEENGGGVANSYGYAAESSRLGIAVWIDPDKTIHTRVAADRVRVSGRHVSGLLPENPAVAIYPVLAFRLLVKEIKTFPKEGRAIAVAARECPGEPANRAALADWLEEYLEANATTMDAYDVKRFREIVRDERAAVELASKICGGCEVSR